MTGVHLRRAFAPFALLIGALVCSTGTLVAQVGPVITSISPGSATAGGPAFTLTVNGSGFGLDAVVQWNGAVLATTPVSATRLTASVSASNISAPGTATITVLAALVLTSNGVSFTINPPPSITSLSPSSAAAAGPAFTLTVSGSGFAVGSVVQWNGAALATTVVSGSQVTAAVAATLLASPGTATVTVASGGVTSNGAPFAIAPPSIASLSPSSATAGAAAFTLTVSGSDFLPSSIVQWEGAALATTFVNASQLTAAVPAVRIASPGTAAVTVKSGAITSASAAFTILPPPVVTSLSPSSAIAGCPLTLTVNGSGFATGSVVRWNGTALATTVVNAGQVTAAVSAVVDASAGTASITVVSGGVSSNAAPFVVGPDPTIASLSPSSATAGGAAFTLTVGGNFAAGSVVLWNGTALATTFVSATQLTAPVPANLLASQGNAAVTVTSGCATSSAATFTINPPPVITSLSPSSATAGSAAFTLTVSGGAFSTSAVIQWNGSALATTFASATQLTAPVSASFIASQGNATVTVLSGGATSNGVVFTVSPPPVITSLSPSSATAGGPAFTLTVSGSGFSSGAAIQWNGAAQATTFVSATQLTAPVAASLLVSQGNATVTVTSGGSTSNGALFTINAPPVITSLSPGSAIAGGPAFTLTVNGSGFSAGAAVQWNGLSLSTTFVGATQLTASVAANLLVGQSGATVTVLSGGVTSNAVSFTISPPVVSSLSPNSATAGGPAFTLTVNGSGFASGAAIQWNGSPLTTNFVSATQLTAPVSASLLANQGNATVAVLSGGVTSSGASFTINAPPVVTSLSPGSVTAGGPAFTITVNGSGFSASSVVQWNGVALATTFVSATQLTASVPDYDISNPGNATITVVSGGVTSNGIVFTANPPPVITSLNPSSATAGGPAFTLTVNGSGFVSGAVVQWNGSPLTTTFVSATQLTAPVAANLITTAATAGVTVSLEGSTSNQANFTIGPAPTISSLSPSTTTAGGIAFTLTVNGSGFTLGSVVNWNGSGLPTSFVNPNTITASVAATLIATAGTASVTVITGGVTSTPAAIFNIVQGPAINSLSPPAITAGAIVAFTLTINGSGFGTDAVAQWNGVPLTTTFVSASQLTAPVTPDLIASAASVPITVVSGGVTSNAVTFSVSSGPALSQLLPGTATAGGGVFTLTVTGTGFSSGTTLQWGGTTPATLLATTFVSPTQLTAAVPAALIASPATVQITAVTTDGVSSNSLSFVVVAPVLTGLSPSMGSPGGGQFALTVTGSGFNANSVVEWNGSQIPTRFDSATQLTATVSSALNQPGPPAQVTVGSLSGGVSSNPVAFALVVPTSVMKLSGLAATSVPTQPLTMNLQVANAFAVDLQGTLTLSFVPNAAGVPSGYMDPALQFASGGTTATFTIKAGTTAPTTAIPNIQQGTVAGQITVTVTSLLAGTVSVLPAAPPTESVAVTQIAPIIESCVAGSVTNGGFTVQLDAYSTPRDLQSAVYTFTAATGATITVTGANGGTVSAPTQISVNVTPQLTQWFAGTASQANGSVFSLTTPFTLTGDATALQSVSVTLKNSIGGSAQFSCVP